MDFLFVDMFFFLSMISHQDKYWYCRHCYRTSLRSFFLILYLINTLSWHEDFKYKLICYQNKLYSKFIHIKDKKKKINYFIWLLLDFGVGGLHEMWLEKGWGDNIEIMPWIWFICCWRSFRHFSHRLWKCF